jgi:hypothetical protein
MPNLNPKRIAIILVVAVALMANPSAFAQFKTGVIGFRPGPRWADTPRGIAVQVTIAVTLAVVTIRVVTWSRPHRRRRWGPPIEDSGAPNEHPEFWERPGRIEKSAP